MYIKLYNKILDSSIANNRQLRHFFTDLLLCSDCDGHVVMTKESIASRIRATPEEVEWGLRELMKPDPISGSPDHDGRRIEPLAGHGYGWKILNYEAYRDLKTAEQMRAATRERVRRWRETHQPAKKPRKPKEPKPEPKARVTPGEVEYLKAEQRGDVEGMNRALENSLPAQCRDATIACPTEEEEVNSKSSYLN